MSILTGKLKKDMEELQRLQTEGLPSNDIRHEKIISDAVKSVSLPSEVQKSMSEILAERLKQTKVKTGEDEDTLLKRAQKQMKLDTVNMGNTLQKSDSENLIKGKMLG